MTDTVLYEQTGHIGRLTLNNPARHNSLGQGELEAIQDYLSAVEMSSDVRVLIVTGAGEKTFCTQLCDSAFHEWSRAGFSWWKRVGF